MIYDEFLQELDRAFEIKAETSHFDESAFQIYTNQIDNLLFSYFDEKKKIKALEMLKSYASGKTLQEIGNTYSLTSTRIGQIIANEIAKINLADVVERNKYLSSLFQFLCSIGYSELISFFSYLKTKKHVLVIILKIVLKEKGFGIKNKEKYKVKNIKPREKFAPDEEIRLFLEKHYSPRNMDFIMISNAATWIVNEYKATNHFGFSGKVTWNKIVDLLIEMKCNNQ